MSATVQYSVSPLSQESEHPALPTSCGSKKERDLGSCPSVLRDMAAFYGHYCVPLFLVSRCVVLSLELSTKLRERFHNIWRRPELEILYQ